MRCCVTDLQAKSVISLKDGCKIGDVCDVEVDTCTGKITAIVVFGNKRMFGLGGREKDICIEWEKIEVIGDDTVLVNFDCPPECKPRRRKSPLDSLFRQG